MAFFHKIFGKYQVPPRVSLFQLEFLHEQLISTVHDYPYHAPSLLYIIDNVQFVMQHYDTIDDTLFFYSMNSILETITKFKMLNGYDRL